MADDTYLCRQCRNVFRSPAPDVPSTAKEVICPVCGSSQAEAVPSWAPIGSNLSEDTPVWECVCQQCQNVFKLPVPDSPSQEKEIICPTCGSGHVHRLTPAGIEPLYCG